MLVVAFLVQGIDMPQDLDGDVPDFNAAFAQATVPQTKVDPDKPLPFIPSQRYVDKNLAPEQSLTYGDVGELAYARKLAETKGVIPKEVGEYMLPMAMREGRPGNFGVNDGNAFNVSPRGLKNAKSMGLAITDMTDPANRERYKFDRMEPKANGEFGNNYYRNTTFQGPNGPTQGEILAEGPPDTPLTIDYAKPKVKPGASAADILAAQKPGNSGPKQIHVQGGGGPGDMAAIMAWMLAEKHALHPGDPEGTVKAYNGSGPKTEQYWQRVNEAKALLNHPRNAPLVAHYNRMYLGN